jgi:glycosyltransferase involved in cell wall biosynthesis
MKNVLVIFSSSSIGGAEKSLMRMIKYQDSHGVEPECKVNYTVSTISGDGPLRTIASDIDKQLITLDLNRYFVLVRPIMFIWKILWILRKYDTDIIYACGLRVNVALRLFKFLFRNVKLVHGVRSNPGSRSRFDRLFCLAENLLKHLTDGYITNSYETKNTLVKKCGVICNKVEVIHNGIPEIKRAVHYKEERVFRVLTVANYSERKGYFDYVDQINGERENLKNVEFLFVGRDDLNGSLHQLVEKMELSDFVKILGFKSELDSLYRSADIFVLPSTYGEGCPTVLLEALSYSVPVLAYDIDGVSEIVEHKKDGILQCVGESLVKPLIAVIGNREQLRQMGESGRKKVLQHFSVRSCRMKHDQFFDKL